MEGLQYTGTVQWKLRCRQFSSSSSFTECTTRGPNQQHDGRLGGTVTTRCTCIRWHDQPLGDDYYNISTSRIRTRHDVSRPSTRQKGQSLQQESQNPFQDGTTLCNLGFVYGGFSFRNASSEWVTIIPYHYVLMDEASQVIEADLFSLFNCIAFTSHPNYVTWPRVFLLDNLISILLIHQHKGYDAFDTRTSYPSRTVWQRKVLRYYMASPEYLRYNWTPTTVWFLTYVKFANCCYIGIFARVSCHMTESKWNTMHVAFVLLR